ARAQAGCAPARQSRPQSPASTPTRVAPSASQRARSRAAPPQRASRKSRVSLTSLRHRPLLRVLPRERTELLDVLRIHRLRTTEPRLVWRAELVVFLRILRR